jgi:phosphatidylglycerophosphatase A
LTPEADAGASTDRVLRLRVLIATVFGVGLAPVAPGTWGSLPGVALAWGIGAFLGPWWVAAALLLVAAAGTWAAEGTARHFGHEDPRPVVVDEVAGQLLTLLFVPPTWQALLAGFLLFRFFDILKPYPAGALERLPGGAGIMADDLAAGIYANLVLQAAIHFAPGLMGTA